MTGSAGVVDFFALEAGEYLDQLDGLVQGAGGRAPETESLARNARALRGAATMARHAPLADLAAAIEAVAGALRDGKQGWTAQVADALTAAIDGYRGLLRRIREWTASDDARAAARAQELRALAVADAPGRAAAVIPIARLYHDDAGPHEVYRNPRPPISADLRFRQAAVPLASTLRRLVGEARHSTDDAARRAVGDDLRGALRDLGELAESYDIKPVVNFARAREAALAALDERTLDIVDGAAQSLIESAGTAWARPTPPSSIGVIEPPAAKRPTPAQGTASVPTPPSGQALVALLETSISTLDRLGDESPFAGTPEPAHANGSDAVVSIESLEYRGRAALARARQVRDELRATGVPDPALLAELYDLLDLAALEETANA